jgi:hypothetical protein
MPRNNDLQRQHVRRENTHVEKQPPAGLIIGRGGDLIIEDDSALEDRKAERVREDTERTLARREAEQDLERRD